jgi:hypothetical protein
MPYINKEKLIGWYNGKTNHFLCAECFYQEGIEDEGYYPVMEDEIESEDLYTCDSCGKKFEEF